MENTTKNMKTVFKEIKNSNSTKKLISRTKRKIKFNEPLIKKIRNRIQTQNEIFNITSFNQSGLKSIDKFFFVNNEKKYLIADIKMLVNEVN